MIKILRCKRCGKEFEGWQNAGYCFECRIPRRLEKERLRIGIARGKPVAEGKWRCPTCGCFKDRHAEVCQTCHNARRHGEKLWNWKGGRLKDSSGYIIILKPEGDEHKHRYILEHRFLWEQVHGKLPKGYVIHHLNGIKDDNRLENLVALPRSAHSGSTVLNVFKTRIRQLEGEIAKLKSDATTPA